LIVTTCNSQVAFLLQVASVRRSHGQKARVVNEIIDVNWWKEISNWIFYL